VWKSTEYPMIKPEIATIKMEMIIKRGNLREGVNPA
jgi:hypothetical protein